MVYCFLKVIFLKPLWKLFLFFFSAQNQFSREERREENMARTKNQPRKVSGGKIPRRQQGTVAAKNPRARAGVSKQQASSVSRGKEVLPIFVRNRPVKGVQSGAPGEGCRYLLHVAHDMHEVFGALPSVASKDRWPVSRVPSAQSETWMKTVAFWGEGNMKAMAHVLRNPILKAAVVPFHAFVKPATVVMQPGGKYNPIEQKCFVVKVVMEGGESLLPKHGLLFHSFLRETIPKFVRAKLIFVDVRKDNAVVMDDGKVRLIDFAGTVYEGTSEEGFRSPLAWVTRADEATESHHLNFIAIADPNAKPLEQQTTDVYMCLTALEAAHEMLGSKVDPYYVVQHFLAGLEQECSSAEECLEVTATAFVSAMDFLLPTAKSSASAV